MATENGRFTWYDLMSNDVEAGKAFYKDVIGWNVIPWEGDIPYSMWAIGDETVGGVMELPAEGGGPPHWLAYIGTSDLDATIKRAEELGGKTRGAPTEIPEVGRFAILSDPQGATFAAFEGSNQAPPRPAAPRQGDFTWHELNTTDWEGAWKFYSALFGWEKTEEMDMGDGMGTYFMFKDVGAANSVGGMSNVASQMNLPPHWLLYVTVDDLNAAIERVKGRGGQLLNGPMEVPGGDKIAQCMDPQGGAFALHWRNPS